MKTDIDLKVLLQDSKPYYVQIYDYLDKLITCNKLQPGDALPSEKELESMFNVSKITVRRAIQDLVYENKIIKIAGKGSFVLQPRIEPLTALTSFSENIRAQGFEPSYIHTVVTFPIPKQKVMDFFGFKKPEKVMSIYRVMCANNSPVAIQTALFPMEIYLKKPSLFTAEVVSQVSIYKILELEIGIKLYRAEETIDIAYAREDEANLLEILNNDPVLIIERRTFSIEEKPIEFVSQIFPSKKYRYKVELFRPGKIN